MKKLIFTLVLALCSIGSWAKFTLERVGGIAYEVDHDAMTAKVENWDIGMQDAALFGYGGYKGDLVIPDSIVVDDQTYTVTALGTYAFDGSTLTSLDIPASVQTFDGDFMGDCQLGSLKVHWTEPFDLESSFYPLIQNILYIPKGTAAKYMQYSCWSDFKEVYEYDEDGTLTPAKYKELVGDLYYNFYIAIGEAEVVGSTRSDEVVIPSSVNFDDITCTVTSIGYEAFYNFQNLTSITIPNTVKKIGKRAFNKCTSLKLFDIPESVTTIKNEAFEYCTGLESLKIPNGMTAIDRFVFYCCSGITSLEIPNNVKSIGDCAFGNCSSLETLTIGKSVTNIEYRAFCDCTNLTTITNLAEVPQKINENIFENIDIKSITLYVPMESVDAYKSANVWNEMNIVGVEGLGIESINDNDDDDDNICPRKVIENGKVVIVRPNGARYNLSGQRTK